MNIIKHAPRSGFFRHNSIFFFGAAAVGALNYLYYPVMGRLLDTISFGEVQTLISLFLQATIFLAALGLIAINVVTNYTSDKLRNAVVLEFEKLALFVGIGIVILVLLFGGVVARFLQFDSVMPLSLLAGALLASVPLTFRGAFLRGKHKFGSVSLVNIVGATGKLLFAVLLVIAGFGTIGAISGLVAAQLMASALVVGIAAKVGLDRPDRSHWIKLPRWHLVAPELRYGALVLAGSLLITLQYSIDVVVVKHYFDPATAGLYAGVASVARIIFFLTASIAMVLLSLVRLQAPKQQNEKVLLKSLALTVIIGLPVLAACALQPSMITQLLMGSAFTEVSNILPRLATAMFVVSILNVFVSYYLALRRFTIAPILGIGALTTYALLYTHHTSLIDVVNGLLIGSLVMLGTLVVWIAGRRAKEFLWQKN